MYGLFCMCSLLFRNFFLIIVNLYALRVQNWKYIIFIIIIQCTYSITCLNFFHQIEKKKELKLIKSCVYDCNTFHFLTFYSEKCKFNTALFLRFSQEYNYSFTSKFISVTCICSLCAWFRGLKVKNIEKNR